MHLTNFSVNKKADNYKKNTQPVGGEPESHSTAAETEESEMSSKWSLQQLKQEYERMGIDYQEVFTNIKQLCVKTLMAVEPQITMAMRSAKARNSCFEVYGFDVIVDSKLRPWLLEVNVAPSLSSSSPYDKQVKTMLLCDTLHLVGFQLFDRKKFEDEKKKETRSRLLGFEPKKRGLQEEEPLTPMRYKGQDESPIKFSQSETRKYGGKKESSKVVVPSFLEGFN